MVALSCKKRGFCPSCLGRRMADTAVHLAERVLPAVPNPALDLLDGVFTGWDRLHTFEGERVVIEGSGHGGNSYVTQAIPRKRS